MHRAAPAVTSAFHLKLHCVSSFEMRFKLNSRALSLQSRRPNKVGKKDKSKEEIAAEKARRKKLALQDSPEKKGKKGKCSRPRLS